MNKIVLEIHDDVVEALEKVKSHDGENITIEFPEGSVVLESIINLKLLKKEAENQGKRLSFVTSDEFGQNLISMINSAEGGSDMGDGFTSGEHAVSANMGYAANSGGYKRKRSFGASRFKLPSFSLGFLRNIFGKGVFKIILILIVLLGLGSAGLYFSLWRVPKAEVKVVVNSQPLIKSVSIKAVNSVPTNPAERILGGSQVSATVSDSATIDTTGEKIVGEKAEGTIIIYNRTDSEIELDDGDIVTFKDTSDRDFVLKDDVTIPPESLEDPLDPTSPSVPGQASVEIEARDVGDEYNVDGGESFEFEDYKRSELFALADGDIDGGSSELVRIVTQEDIDNVIQEVTDKMAEYIGKSTESRVTRSQRQIEGSEEQTITIQNFSAELDEEADELTLEQTVQVTSLAYSTGDLDDLVDELVAGFVPDGFTLSDEEREVNVEVLGNTDSTVLSNTEADLQVTLKSFVIPVLEEDQIKQQLSGKDLEEADSILNNIRNVSSYELSVSPSIPFFRRVPNNVENINLQIVRE